MNRRGFFRLFGTGLGALAVPEPWWKKVWEWCKPAPINTVALQLERVRAKLPTPFEQEASFYMIDGGDLGCGSCFIYERINGQVVERISNRVARIPLRISPGFSSAGAHCKMRVKFDPNRLPD